MVPISSDLIFKRIENIYLLMIPIESLRYLKFLGAVRKETFAADRV